MLRILMSHDFRVGKNVFGYYVLNNLLSDIKFNIASFKQSNTPTSLKG